MADQHIVTIKVNIESATGDGASSDSGGGAANITGAVVRSIKQLQDEFRNLSASVRSVSTSLEQLKNVKEGATGSTGAPSGVSSKVQGPNITEAVKALNSVEEAAKGAAAASKEQASATDEATQAAERATRAENTQAEMDEKATKAMRDKAAATEAATEADIAQIKALKLIEGNAPRRNKKDRLNYPQHYD